MKVELLLCTVLEVVNHKLQRHNEAILRFCIVVSASVSANIVKSAYPTSGRLRGCQANAG